jgi:hypothetical protein
MKLFDLGTTMLSADDGVFKVRPVEDFLELLGFNVAKLEPVIVDSRGHGYRVGRLKRAGMKSSHFFGKWIVSFCGGFRLFHPTPANAGDRSGRQRTLKIANL